MKRCAPILQGGSDVNTDLLNLQTLSLEALQALETQLVAESKKPGKSDFVEYQVLGPLRRVRAVIATKQPVKSEVHPTPVESGYGHGV
jgi:hypothetical protein